MIVNLRTAATIAVALVLTAAAGCGSGANINADASQTKDVEVFTWWADGGEKAGLDALAGTFASACSEYRFVNGSIRRKVGASGGASSDAKQALATRLQQGVPPETFHVHAGAELSDYVKGNQAEDLSAQYQQLGLTNAFPKGLIDDLTIDGKIYSVPVNIHRTNVMWVNRKVLSSAGITAYPKTLAELFTDLDILRAKGERSPLAVGRDWTQLMLFEAVLIADLGPEQFRGLWKGTGDWSGADVARAVEDYRRLLTYSAGNRNDLDWNDAEKLLVNGTAAVQLMGDWEAGDLDSKGFEDYGYFAFPGNGNAFQWMADSFVLGKGARNVEGAKCWLKTVGSVDGQKAFSTKEGSIPARVDVAAAGYSTYRQSAMADWKTGVQVPSCAHGSACSTGLQTAVNAALAKFGSAGDAAVLQNSIGSAVKEWRRSA